MPKKVRHQSDSDSDTDSEDFKKYGEPHKYDPKFKGPISNRGCTDVVCCLIFVAFLFGEAFIAFIAIKNGDPDTIFKPVDYLGQVCGESPAVENKTDLFYFDWLDCLSSTALITLRCPTTRVCVEACTAETYSIYARYPAQLALDTPIDVDWSDFVCRYDVDPEAAVLTGEETMMSLLDKNLCAGYYWESEPFENRCVPETVLVDDSEGVNQPHGRNLTEEEVENSITLINRFQNSATVDKLIEDFWETWPFVIGFVGVTAAVAFLCIVIMRWLATIILLASFVVSLIAFTWGSYYTWNEYLCYKNGEAGCIPLDFDDPNFDYYSLESYAQLSTTWLVFAITLTVLGALELLIALTLCNRFRIALSLIELASDALSFMTLALFWPIVPFVLTLLYVFFWAIVTAYLASTTTVTYAIIDAPDGSPLTDGDACSPDTFVLNSTVDTRCDPVWYGVEDYYIVLQLYNLFMLFWAQNFILALGEMTLAGAFASYYWTGNKPDDLPSVPILSSFWRCIRYHLGSLAFGSLIVSIVQFVRALLEYVENQTKEIQNPITKLIFKCCQCCLWCLEKFLRFINRNAYIDIAVYGHSFCKAARHVFNLFMRNILRVAVVNSVTGFMLLVLKLTITAAVTVGSFYFFTWLSEQDGAFVPTTNYMWAPVVVIGILSFTICSAFFSVYDMAVDTMFISFLEDIERHDGSPDRPYYMPKELLGIIGKKNKCLQSIADERKYDRIKTIQLKDMSDEMAGQMQFKTALKATIVRVAFMLHSLAAIFATVYTSQNSLYWFLSAAFIVMGLEMLITYNFNETGEWKWFVPSAFIYLAIVVPVIWFLELDQLRFRRDLQKQLGTVSICPVTISATDFESYTCFANKTLQDIESSRGQDAEIYGLQNEFSTILQQTLMMVLILGRWMMPRGQLSRDQLSQLLLVYIGMAADMLEFSLETLNIDQIACDKEIFIVILCVWSWSLLQFTLGLTATKGPKRRAFGKVNRSEADEKEREEKRKSRKEKFRRSHGTLAVLLCGTEVWALLTSVILQDGPYFITRIYLIIAFRIIDQTMFFFTCKNALLLILQFYRLFVVLHESAKSRKKSKAKNDVEQGNSTRARANGNHSVGNGNAHAIQLDTITELPDGLGRR